MAGFTLKDFLAGSLIPPLSVSAAKVAPTLATTKSKIWNKILKAHYAAAFDKNGTTRGREKLVFSIPANVPFTGGGVASSVVYISVDDADRLGLPEY